LISAIEEDGVEGMTLLDIGGGVGGVQHALLIDGVVEAIHVDASSAYVRAAREEAERRNLDCRIKFRQGNFVDLAQELPVVDLVTLDRVICCYDEMEPLVRLSAKKARERIGLVFPRDFRIFRIFLPLVNFVLGLRGTPFRIYLHDTQSVDRVIKEQGFNRRFHKNSGFWQTLVYNRD
jgi:magnesium-protoporphyrin O-methyltransferase